MELSMSSQPLTTGPSTAWLFGKLPTHGDFIARGLNPARRDELDLWLSNEMVQAREVFGLRFEDAYDAATPWLLRARDDAGHWQGAAICPSVDAAGRRFPIIAGAGAGDAAAATGLAIGAEQAIYRAFEHGLSADGLYPLLANDNVAATLAPEVPLAEGWWRDGNERVGPDHLAGFAPTGLVTRMLRDFIDG
jgi:type VI secretion system protein ImpM